jgi:hypothetical protein
MLLSTDGLLAVYWRIVAVSSNRGTEHNRNIAAAMAWATMAKGLYSLGTSHPQSN